MSELILKKSYFELWIFLIDIPVFPGTSGAPVFAFGYGLEFLPSGGMSAGRKCLFLGILYAVLRYYNKEPGAVMEHIPTDSRSLTASDLISNGSSDQIYQTKRF